VGVYPDAAELPENLLRWYIAFSAPMAPGSALEHVHLFEGGREIPHAFLDVGQELWDPARTRLTLLFDPGRVKRGVRTNLEFGPPLLAGHAYRLTIDADWMDGRGAPLATAYELSFVAVRATRAAVDPRGWRVDPPVAATCEPMRILFGRVIDHELARRTLGIYDQWNAPVEGRGVLADHDRQWQFTPARAWAGTEYRLRIDSQLEDVAGNSVMRVFDRDRHSPGDRTLDPSTAQFRTIAFRPVRPRPNAVPLRQSCR
jgi:hypothetical protein